MPLYEFQCSSCEHIFEELIFSDEKAECPQCHSEKTEKLLSRPCRNRASGALLSSDSGAMLSKSACSGCAGGSCGTCGS